MVIPLRIGPAVTGRRGLQQAFPSKRPALFALAAVCAGLLSAPAASHAQSVHVSARVDSNSILIGDWLPYHIEVEHHGNSTVIFPSLPDSLNGFEVVRRDPPVKKSSNGSMLESATFVLTAFDSGMHIVPPLTVQYMNAGDTTKHAMDTPPVVVVVHGMQVDTSQEIKDVKPPLSLPLTLADFLPYIIGAVAIGGLIWLLIYIRKKRKRGESLIPQAPPRPANEVALSALRSLESEKLWQRGKIKEYHSGITDILRLYIEGRFLFAALESTSGEILGSSPIRSLPGDEREALRELLTRADLVKFAKFQPVPEEHERSLRLAVSFVESTWRRVAQQVPAETAAEIDQAPA